MCPMLYDGIGHPVTLTPGGNDLRWSSGPVGDWGPGHRATLVDGRTVSYAWLFATQPSIAAVVMRLLTYSLRVPLKMYERTGEDSRERLREKDHPLARALVDPWERGSQAQLVMSLLGPLLVHGNGLNDVQSGAGETIRFDPCDWRWSWPIMPYRDTIVGWRIDQEDEERYVGVDSMLHVAYWSPLGPKGISPLQQLGTTIGIEDAAQRHQRSMLANGARPGSAITASDRFLEESPENRDALLAQLRADITSLYSGPENAGKPALLPPGLDWKPVGQTSQEAQLIEQRQVAWSEVCSVYQMPPGAMGHLQRGNNDLEQQRTMAYTDGLAPPLILIEQAMNSQVIRGLLREQDRYVEFDFSAVLRGDRLKEVEAYREAIASAILTPNEVRAMDNRPRSDVPAMDEFYLPFNNLWPVGKQHPKVAGRDLTQGDRTPAGDGDPPPPGEGLPANSDT